MTDIETIEIIKKYILKKKFEIEIGSVDKNYISFYYNLNDSDYCINIFIEKNKNNQSVIKYYSNCNILNINRLRTSVSSKNYLRSIYDNLIYIKTELNKISRYEKERYDNNKKYCTELESHYKKIHDNVNIEVFFPNDDNINIKITGYNNNKITIYSINYTDNKYYLNSLEEKYSPNKTI